MTTLPEKVLALAAHLGRAGVPHAFGGALALAYCTEDPRGTRDVDVNVFVPAEEADPVLQALPAGVRVPEGTAQLVATSGQVRLWWDDTPVDLFFDYAPLHAQAARGRRRVPFSSGEIEVLGALELVLFKALFDRPQDRVDISGVLEAGAVDRAAVRDALVGLLGSDDGRVLRLDGL